MAGEYIINYSSDSLKDAFTILPRTVNNDTSLTLFGKGAPSYGEGLQENLVHLLENFCSNTSPARPTVGQLWYHNDSQLLQICTSISPVTWHAVGIQTASTAPTSVAVGTLWFNTISGELNYWDGTQWVPIGGSGASVTVGTTAPTGPKVGQLWVDTNIGVLRYWSGTEWTAVGTNNAETAYVAAIMVQISPVRANYLSTISSNVQTQIDTLSSDLSTALSTTVAGKVNIAGDTMTGFLSLSADPAVALHAATKRYVDMAVFNALKSIGGTNSSAQQHQLEMYATTDNQTVFTLPVTPTAAHVVYVSGVEQSLNNYTLVDATLTLSTGVAINTEIMVDYYDIGNTPGVSAIHIQTQTATDAQTVFTITIPYVTGQNALMVFVDGIKQQITNAYTETSTTSITFNTPLVVGTEVTTVSYALNGTAAIQLNTFVATAGQTNFTITPAYHHTNVPSDPLNVNAMVYVAGVAQGANEYTETNGTSIILSSGVSVGTPVDIYIFNIN